MGSGERTRQSYAQAPPRGGAVVWPAMGAVDVTAVLGKVGLPEPLAALAARDWDAIVVGGGHNGIEGLLAYEGLFERCRQALRMARPATPGSASPRLGDRAQRQDRGGSRARAHAVRRPDRKGAADGVRHDRRAASAARAPADGRRRDQRGVLALQRAPRPCWIAFLVFLVSG